MASARDGNERGHGRLRIIASDPMMPLTSVANVNVQAAARRVSSSSSPSRHDLGAVNVARKRWDTNLTVKSGGVLNFTAGDWNTCSR